MEYGLIGEHLPHSFSKTIHERISDYSYELKELRREELDAFMRSADFKGINVTIPYKQAVIPYLSGISDKARRIGAVNTVVNRNGKLYGDNTDYDGMKSLVKRLGIDPAGSKVLIAGTGGTSKTAEAVFTDLGASSIFKVSRSGREGAATYEEAYEKHADAQILINTTPCGMFPETGGLPVEIGRFPDLRGVVDVIYNPLRTRLVQEALKRGILSEGGLYMLVLQAVRAAELFTGNVYEDDLGGRIFAEILNEKRNIVLTGMSQAGKSTVGRILADRLHRELVDTDEEIVAAEGRRIRDIFAEDGEQYFREAEAKVIRDLAVRNGLVIATGGGAVLREENVEALRMNGILFFLDRPAGELVPDSERPLADSEEKILARLRERMPVYRSTCDVYVRNDVSAEDAAEKVLNALFAKC